jgi:hypothetical protein
MMDLESIIKEQWSSRRDFIYLVLFRELIACLEFEVSIHKTPLGYNLSTEPYKSRHRAIVTAANFQRRCGLALADPPLRTLALRNQN